MSDHAYERLLAAAMNNGRTLCKQIANDLTDEALDECFGMATADMEHALKTSAAPAIWPYQIVRQVCNDSKRIRKGEMNER